METLKVFGLLLIAVTTGVLWAWATKWLSERICEAIGRPDSIPAYMVVVSIFASATVSVVATAFK